MVKSGVIRRKYGDVVTEVGDSQVGRVPRVVLVMVGTGWDWGRGVIPGEGGN